MHFSARFPKNSFLPLNIPVEKLTYLTKNKNCIQEQNMDRRVPNQCEPVPTGCSKGDTSGKKLRLFFGCKKIVTFWQKIGVFIFSSKTTIVEARNKFGYIEQAFDSCGIDGHYHPSQKAKELTRKF